MLHHKHLISFGVGLLVYRAVCPSWQKTLSLLQVPVNVPPDHLAWRTFGRAGGVENVGRVLEREGYRSVGHYNFPNICVTAQHFEHIHQPDHYPLVFASQLDDHELPMEAQNIIHKRLMQKPNRKWNGVSTGTDLWGLPNYADFKTLEQHSKYAAWVYVFGNLLNHAATNVDFSGLEVAKGRDNYGEKLANCVGILEAQKMEMNCDEGSVINISRDGLLHQASIRGDPILVRWSDGKLRAIPGASVELLQRLIDPASGEPKEGFEVENATRLFTATNIVTKHD